MFSRLFSKESELENILKGRGDNWFLNERYDNLGLYLDKKVSEDELKKAEEFVFIHEKRYSSRFEDGKKELGTKLENIKDKIECKKVEGLIEKYEIKSRDRFFKKKVDKKLSAINDIVLGNIPEYFNYDQRFVKLNEELDGIDSIKSYADIKAVDEIKLNLKTNRYLHKKLAKDKALRKCVVDCINKLEYLTDTDKQIEKLKERKEGRTKKSRWFGLAAASIAAIVGATAITASYITRPEPCMARTHNSIKLANGKNQAYEEIASKSASFDNDFGHGLIYDLKQKRLVRVKNDLQTNIQPIEDAKPKIEERKKKKEQKNIVKKPVKNVKTAIVDKVEYKPTVSETITDLNSYYLPELTDREYKTGEYALLIYKPDQKMGVYQKDQERWDFIKSYNISTGLNPGNKTKGGDCKTPEGIFSICQIQDSSTWEFQGKDANPEKGDYGPYFLRLGGGRWRSIGIHGTNEPYKLGQRASHGCIRLANENIAEVKNKYVKEGTPVVIKG